MKQTNIMNGVNVDNLIDTVKAIKSTPTLASFTFKANNKWMDGGLNRTTIKDFYGTCQDMSHRQEFIFDNDEPPVLLGTDLGANPVEFVLHALAGCLTTTLVYHAAAMGEKIDEVESRFEGDLDLHGFLGLNDTIRNGYQNIRVMYKIKGNMSEERKKELIQIAQARSPVFDIVTNKVPVEVQLESIEKAA